MSIEKLIEENTAAISALTKVLLDRLASFDKERLTATAEGGEQVKSSDKKADTKKSTADSASSVKGAGQAASEKSDNAKDKPAASKEETEALYAKIRQPFLDLVAADRPKAQALLDEMGVKALKAAGYEQLLIAQAALVKADSEDDIA